MALLHEQTYKGWGISALVHRARRNKIFEIFSKIKIAPEGKLADFGCSNGYLVSLLKRKFFDVKKWKFFGFDFSEELLGQARDRKLPDVEFHHFNLNEINDAWNDRFDVIVSFETLEHVANYRIALSNLYNTCKKGGRIIISVPNEVGLPGLLKYIGRKLTRLNPHGNFFKNQSEWKYFWYLICNKPIEDFRKSTAHGYGPHLGFNWRTFEKYLYGNYIENKKCKLPFKSSSFLQFNFIYVLEKEQ